MASCEIFQYNNSVVVRVNGERISEPPVRKGGQVVKVLGDKVFINGYEWKNILPFISVDKNFVAQHLYYLATLSYRWL